MAGSRRVAAALASHRRRGGGHLDDHLLLPPPAITSALRRHGPKDHTPPPAWVLAASTLALLSLPPPAALVLLLQMHARFKQRENMPLRCRFYLRVQHYTGTRSTVGTFQVGEVYRVEVTPEHGEKPLPRSFDHNAVLLRSYGGLG